MAKITKLETIQQFALGILNELPDALKGNKEPATKEELLAFQAVYQKIRDYFAGKKVELLDVDFESMEACMFADQQVRYFDAVLDSLKKKLEAC